MIEEGEEEKLDKAEKKAATDAAKAQKEAEKHPD